MALTAAQNKIVNQLKGKLSELSAKAPTMTQAQLDSSGKIVTSLSDTLSKATSKSSTPTKITSTTGGTTGGAKTTGGTTAPTIEPTTISDMNVRDTYIPKIDTKINKFAETGQYYDQNGNLHNADGTISDSNSQTDSQNTDMYSSDQVQVDSLNASANQDTKLMMDTLDKLMKQTDSTTASLIGSIKSQYDTRRSQLEEVNRREQASEATSLLLGGSTRYTGSASGIMAGYQRADIMELADLDAKEMAAIAEAKSAQASQNYKIASQKIDLVEKLRKEKIDKATKIAETIAEENKKARENMIKMSRESAIADLFTQGITDAKDILDYINYDESGNAIGDVSLKEIQDVLDIINPSANLDGASSDYKTYKIAQKNGDIPQSWSYFDYQTAVKNASNGGSGGFTSTEKRKLEQAGLLNSSRQEQLDYLYGGSSTSELTAEDKRTLIGAGFTNAEIEDIPRAIADFGIDAVVSELDTRKASALKKVYNSQDPLTVDKIQSTVTQKVAQDGLKKAYTDEELVKLARDNGFAQFFSGDEGEVEDFLNSDKAKELYTELLVQQYRDAGMLSE